MFASTLGAGRSRPKLGDGALGLPPTCSQVEYSMANQLVTTSSLSGSAGTQDANSDAASVDSVSTSAESVHAAMLETLAPRRTNKTGIAPRSALRSLIREPKPTLKVSSTTTLADLPLANDRINDKLAARFSRQGEVILRWSKKAAPPQAELDLAKVAFQNIIAQTAAVSGADDGIPNPSLEQALTTLKEAGWVDPFFAEVVANILRRAQVLKLNSVGRAEETSSELNSPGTDEEVHLDLPKVPTECIPAWLQTLEQAMATVPPNGPAADLIRGMKNAARSMWMRHDLKVEATRNYLLNCANACEDQLPDLAKMAGALAKDLERHGNNEPPLIRLQDNINARVWESAFVVALLDAKLEPVQEAAHRLSSFVANELDRLAPEDIGTVYGQLLQDYSMDKPRPWSDERPDAQAFTSASTRPAALNQLKTFLRRKPDNVMDCVPLLLLSHYSAVSMRPDPVPPGHWTEKCDAIYFEQIKPTRSRKKPLAPPLTQGGGITLKYQPTAAPMEPWAYRGAIGTTPNLKPKEMTPVTKTILQHGAPLASGVAGTMHLVGHLIDHANSSANAQIDKDLAQLSHAITVVLDGGHSMWEALWPIDFNRFLEGKPPRFCAVIDGAYVPDYDAYLRSFNDPDVASALQQAVETAWTALFTYREKHLGAASSLWTGNEPKSESSSLHSPAKSIEPDIETSAHIAFKWLDQNKA